MLPTATQAPINPLFTHQKVKEAYPSLYEILKPIKEKITNWNFLGHIFQQAVLNNASQNKPVHRNILEAGFVFSVVLRIPMNDPVAHLLKITPANLVVNQSSEEVLLVINSINEKIFETISELSKPYQNSEIPHLSQNLIRTELGEQFIAASRICLIQCQIFKTQTTVGNEMEPAPRTMLSSTKGQEVTVNQDARQKRASASKKRTQVSEEIEPIAGAMRGLDGAQRKVEKVISVAEVEFENMSAEQKVTFLMRKIDELKSEHKAEIQAREFVIQELTTEVGATLRQQEALTAERDALQVAMTTMASNEAHIRTRLEDAENKYNILLGVTIGVAIVAAGAVFGPKVASTIAEFFGRK